MSTPKGAQFTTFHLSALLCWADMRSLHWCFNLVAGCRSTLHQAVPAQTPATAGCAMHLTRAKSMSIISCTAQVSCTAQGAAGDAADYSNPELGVLLQASFDRGLHTGYSQSLEKPPSAGLSHIDPDQVTHTNYLRKALNCQMARSHLHSSYRMAWLHSRDHEVSADVLRA